MMKHRNILQMFVFFALLLQSSLFAVQDGEKNPTVVPPKDKCYLTQMAPQVFKENLVGYLPLKDEASLMVALAADKNQRNLSKKRLAEIKNILAGIDNILDREVEKLHRNTRAPCFLNLEDLLRSEALESECVRKAQKLLGKYADITWLKSYEKARLIEIFLARSGRPRAYSCGNRYCGFNVLLFAIENGHGRATKVVLDAGVDPNERLSWIKGSPLISAVRSNQPEIVRILLKYGARPSDIWLDKEMSALDFALENNNDEVVKILREAKAQHASQIKAEFELRTFMFRSGMLMLGAVCALGYYLYKKWKAKKAGQNKRVSNQRRNIAPQPN